MRTELAVWCVAALSRMWGQATHARDITLLEGRGELLQFQKDIQRVVISEPRMVPTVRLTFWMGSRMSTGSRRSSAGRQRGTSVVRSSERSSPWSCATVRRTATSGPAAGRWRMAEKSRPRAFQWSIAGATSIRSTRPIISSIVRKPRRAMYSRTSSAM